MGITVAINVIEHKQTEKFFHSDRPGRDIFPYSNRNVLIATVIFVIRATSGKKAGKYYSLDGKYVGKKAPGKKGVYVVGKKKFVK